MIVRSEATPTSTPLKAAPTHTSTPRTSTANLAANDLGHRTAGRVDSTSSGEVEVDYLKWVSESKKSGNGAKEDVVAKDGSNSAMSAESGVNADEVLTSPEGGNSSSSSGIGEDAHGVRNSSPDSGYEQSTGKTFRKHDRAPFPDFNIFFSTHFRRETSRLQERAPRASNPRGWKVDLGVLDTDLLE